MVWPQATLKDGTDDGDDDGIACAVKIFRVRCAKMGGSRGDDSEFLSFFEGDALLSIHYRTRGGETGGGMAERMNGTVCETKSLLRRTDWTATAWSKRRERKSPRTAKRDPVSCREISRPRTNRSVSH
jgi:hypothetical protein